MAEENKTKDPMPPPDATPEEIGEFWDTHSLADYWDETHEVEFEVNLKSTQNPTPDTPAQKKDISMSDETKHDLPATTEDETNVDLDIVPEDTAGNALEVVTNFISGLDPSTWLGRNAYKAFGKLCSAPSKWYNAYFEGKAAETQVESEARVKIIEEITSQIVQDIKVDPEYARRAGRKFAGKIIGEQINLDKISAIAANELKNSESSNPETSEPNKEQSTDSKNQGTDSGEERTIDDVWLNIFETEARPRSTEEAQLLFGRILAGEINNPGSYSIKAVKILGELDQNTASLFKKLCSASVVNGVFGIPGEQVFDIRVSSFSGNPGSNALGKYGLGFDQLNLLNGYDLIISDYNSWFDYNMCIVNQNNPVLLPFQYQGKHWVLSPLPEQENKPELRISGVALSHVGRELFRIVDHDPMPEYTEDLQKFFLRQNLQMVETSTSSPIILRTEFNE